ncbi:hypothetical protein GBA52_025202 [Prunus armeniaca]|nr:hypothetical protein GBA52_025202 [Prunus armeniaca]
MDSSSGGPLCLPTIPSQLVGPGGVVPSPYTRPYMMSFPVVVVMLTLMVGNGVVRVLTLMPGQELQKQSGEMRG